MNATITYCPSCEDTAVEPPEQLCETCQWLQDLPNAPGPRISHLRRIVDQHHFDKIDGQVVDATTANLLVKVYEALSPTNRKKFETMNFLRLVDFAWKQVK